jgi:hypothetical protein
MKERGMKVERMQQELSHVYWLVGSPCAGKSSLADALVATYGWQLYRGDDTYEHHASIATPKQLPTFSKITRLSSDAFWMRPLAQQLFEKIQSYKEEFPLILADLLAFSKTKPVVAEGTSLLPGLVAPLLNSPHQAIGLVPTPEFQVKCYLQRRWVKELVAKAAYPEQTFALWMQRNVYFAAYVAQEALAHDVLAIQVDGSRSLEEHTKMVEQYFHLS